MQSKMTNSMIVENDDVSESVIDGLIDQLGELPTDFFDVTIIVTVVVTPLPDEDEVVRLSRPHHK